MMLALLLAWLVTLALVIAGAMMLFDGMLAAIVVFAFVIVSIFGAAPVLLGLGLAIPFAVLTSHPAVGRWAARVGLCAVPEERSAPPILAAAFVRRPSEEPSLAA